MFWHAAATKAVLSTKETSGWIWSYVLTVVRYSRLLAAILKTCPSISKGVKKLSRPHGKWLQICLHLCHLILKKHGNTLKIPMTSAIKPGRSPGQNVEPIAFIFILAMFFKKDMAIFQTSPIGPGWTKVRNHETNRLTGISAWKHWPKITTTSPRDLKYVTRILVRWQKNLIWLMSLFTLSNQTLGCFFRNMANLVKPR